MFLCTVVMVFESHVLYSMAFDTSRLLEDNDVTTLSTDFGQSYYSVSTPGKEDPFSEHFNLSLSTENITSCFSQKRILSIVTESGFLTYFYTPNYTLSKALNTSDSRLLIGYCLIEVSLPPELIMRVQVLEAQFVSNASCLMVFDSPDWPAVIRTCGSGTSLPAAKNSSTNSVIFQVETILSNTFSLRLEFKGMARDPLRSLQLNYTSSKQGYLQTPYWDGERSNPSSVDTWIRVAVPADHFAFTKLLMSDLEIHLSSKLYGNGEITLYSNSTVIWTWLGEFPTPVTLLKTNVFFVHYSNEDMINFTGFRLNFSFHNVSSLPFQTPGGRWDCSMPQWVEFKYHLSCDFKVQCINGEDEVDCPYKRDVCKNGFLTTGGYCFLLKEMGQKISWNSAFDTCVQNKGRLASINTMDKYKDTMKFLHSQLPLQPSTCVLIGLRSSAPALGHMYKWTFQWLDESVTYSISVSAELSPACGMLCLKGNYFTTTCYTPTYSKFLCEMTTASALSTTTSSPSVLIAPPFAYNATRDTTPQSNNSLLQCPGGHLTQVFLACDVHSACWNNGYAACSAPLTPLPPYFTCSNEMERIPYTLLCDYRHDCSDGSDESFCAFPPCKNGYNQQCGNVQCLSRKERCDGLEQCVNGADETGCPGRSVFFLVTLYTTRVSSVRPPAVVFLDGKGSYTMQSYAQGMLGKEYASMKCPDTHFHCPGSGYCLPVFVLCNEVYDCPGHEDEAGCDNYRCPGFYRCRASRVCLHTSHLCDGVFQCPRHDDELLCNLSCPEMCTCHGLSFVCIRSFPASGFPDLRFVDARGTGMTPDDFSNNMFLIYLNLSNCDLKDFNPIHLKNLQTLDLSDNKLNSFRRDSLRDVINLRALNLAGNPLTTIFHPDRSTQFIFQNILDLDLSRVYMAELNVSAFAIFPNLQNFNLKDNRIDRVMWGGFQTLKNIRKLDLRGSPVTDFSGDIFKGLDKLETVLADNFKLCCPATLPKVFTLHNCQAPSDEISSCSDLLGSDVYRAFLAVVLVLALLGNMSSFLYRVFLYRTAAQHGYDVFVTHLCVSDFLMSVYLMILGVADWMYQGRYLWEDLAWRKSTACKFAGFLSLLSNEVSPIIVCLITLDRFLVLRFPFSRLHFRRRSAHVACFLTWCAGVVVAALPLLPLTSDREFFSQSGICIPLPITGKPFQGKSYSFGILIVFNFVLVFLVAVGQLFIFWSIRTNSMPGTETTKRSQDVIIARRLISVALPDFLCWFPIGLLGLLSLNGVAIPGEVNIAIVIFLLPLNSALNPYLYTLNIIHERWRRIKEEREEKRILSQLKLQYGYCMMDASQLPNK